MYAGNWCTSVPSFGLDILRGVAAALPFMVTMTRSLWTYWLVKCAPSTIYRSQEQNAVPLYLISYLKANNKDNKNSSQRVAARMKLATSSEQIR